MTFWDYQILLINNSLKNNKLLNKALKNYTTIKNAYQNIYKMKYNKIFNDYKFIFKFLLVIVLLNIDCSPLLLLIISLFPLNLIHY